MLVSYLAWVNESICCSNRNSSWHGLHFEFSNHGRGLIAWVQVERHLHGRSQLLVNFSSFLGMCFLDLVSGVHVAESQHKWYAILEDAPVIEKPLATALIWHDMLGSQLMNPLKVHEYSEKEHTSNDAQVESTDALVSARSCHMQLFLIIVCADKFEGVDT